MGQKRAHADVHPNPHVPLGKLEPVSGFLTGHNPPLKLSFIYGFALAALVWSVTPIAWIILLRRAYVTGELISISIGFWAKFWYIYSLFEVPFSLYLAVLTWRAGREPPPLEVDLETLNLLLTKSLTAGLGPATPAEGVRNRKKGEKENGRPKVGMDAMKDRPVDPQDAAERRERLRSWFHFAPVSDIYEDNVREWLAWAFAARSLQDTLADPKYAELINGGLEMVKRRTAWDDMKKGYNPTVKSIRLTLDPVRTMHRPFGYYVVTNGVSWGTIVWLRLFKGFKKERSGKCEFLVKPPKALKKGEKRGLPIVFLHGLGIGLGQYITLLKKLGDHRDGVVILLQPHISTNIFSSQFLSPPSKDDQAAALISLLSKHHMSSVATLSHSNGTMVLGWLLRHSPSLFVRNILVDPVSFCLWEGSVCYSFIHRRWATGIEVLLGYFVGRELGTAHTIARRFLWFDMILWADEFPSLKPGELHFVFGERDVLVDVPGSVGYLRGAGVEEDCITVMRGYNHGQALIVDNAGMKLALEKVGLRT